jgi:SAM-dependent methyltransferase
MVFDQHRNGFYARAMQQRINPESVVLDLGSGLGIHGLMAAKMGARHVYLVEPTEVVRAAEMLARENGLQNRITCIQGLIEEVELPEKVDLIISVFTGNFLLEEDLLPSLFYARDRYLKPGGNLVPDRGTMSVAPVTLEGIFNKHIESWSQPNQELDFSMLRKYAANHTYYDDYSSKEYVRLGGPERLLELDFSTAKYAACQSAVSIEVSKNGLCHGFLGWFEARMGNEWLSTAPDAEKTHWSQVYLPLDPPLELQRGKALDIRLNRPEYGPWSWEVQYQNFRQKHSTFLAQPLSPADLARKSDSHKAMLSKKGKVAQQVLGLLDGSHNTEEISLLINQQHPHLFPSQLSAKRWVQGLIQSFS